MMKRIFSALMCLLMLFTALPAMADQPQPIETIPYEQIPVNANGQYHYLLLCMDHWNGGTNGNSDGIVLLTFDTRAPRIMLTSLLRDSLVERPDGKIGRINYIAKNYGPEALCKVISQHIGVKVEKYILFDFNQIQTIIDYMGGVNITVTDAEADYLNRYRISRTATTPSMNKAGTYLFGGHAAVIYMRIRKAGGGGDFMRTQRVRTVLSTLADQCREITYDEALALVDNVMANTTLTNMNLDEMVQAMEYAYELRGCTIEELRIPQDGDATPINYASMSVQEIDWVSSRAHMDDFLQNSFLVLDD